MEVVRRDPGARLTASLLVQLLSVGSCLLLLRAAEVFSLLPKCSSLCLPFVLSSMSLPRGCITFFNTLRSSETSCSRLCGQILFIWYGRHSVSSVPLRTRSYATSYAKLPRYRRICSRSRLGLFGEPPTRSSNASHGSCRGRW